jgi:hypothetical protein
MQDLLSPSGDTKEEIAEVCDSIKELLLSKNNQYGDSALDPIRLFSEANVIEQLKVRIDDKLSRISRGGGCTEREEDVINDLIGYLVLLKIAFNRDLGFSNAYRDIVSQDSESSLSCTSSEYWPTDPWTKTFGRYRYSD